MLESIGDIWKARQPGDWVVVTTNSTIRKDGALVMGRGIALEASSRYKNLQGDLGYWIKLHGVRLEVLHNTRLIAFPVKHHFKDKADINLILRSTIQLVEAAYKIGGRILMPRVGCGFGRLDWAEVEPMLRNYLTSDRFVVFHKEVKNEFR